MIGSKCLLDVGNLRGSNRQSLDLAGGKRAEITHGFDVPCSYQLPKTSRPAQGKDMTPVKVVYSEIN